MVNQDLIDYIKINLEKGHSRESIRDNLKKHGWRQHEIQEAFSILRREYSPPVPEPSERDSGSISLSEGSGYHRKFFSLQEDEKIAFESKPLRGYLWYMLVTSLITLAFFLFFLGGLIFFPLAVIAILGYESGVLVLIPVLIIFIILIIDLLLVRRRYNMRYYWLTNNRVIIKKGLIGYSINSIPLERISDVLISRSFLERVFRFGSLHIQSLAGQFTPGSRSGSEGNLRAIPDPEKNQKLIFDLIKQRRRSANLTI
jgi:membrane protein YdbS with pleckstrin-like domain